MSFDELFKRWTWKPIPNCPGRFVLRDVPPNLLPQQLLSSEVKIREFQTARARDTVLVVQIEGGGLISYRRANGTHCHTLNTPEGFERKLNDLGLNPEPSQTEPRA